jgi:hypothetical protein
MIDSRIRVLIPLVVLISASPLAAQTAESAIRGLVVDPQGKSVPNAKVRLRTPDGAVRREIGTASDGGFTFASISPGVYQVDVEADGFKTTTQSGVQAPVSSTIDVRIRLELGSVSDSVAVTAAVDPLQATDASIGINFESRRIEQLPLNARNIVGLLSLQPGVTRSGEVFGGRRDQANITLDGVDVNDQLTGLDVTAKNLQGTNEALGSVLRSTPESVQEFRVVTLNPNASQGRSSGAQVALVTRSGSNEFHGAAYAFHRNTLTTANDWFNNAAGRYAQADAQVQQGIATAGAERAPRPKLIRNVFGAALGGPIRRNRTFFFVNYEGRRDASETTASRTVPSETLRDGILRYQNSAGGVTTVEPIQLASLFPGTGGVNPIVPVYLRRAALPNFSGTGDGLNFLGFRFNAKTPANLDTYILRLDHRISAKQSLFARGNVQEDQYTLVKQFPDSPTPALWTHPKGFVAGHEWTITPNIVNSARVGLTRQAFSYRGDSDANVIRFFSYRPTSEQRSSARISPTWNITDDISWSKGKHLVQFGGNFRSIENRVSSLAQSFDLLSTNFAFYPGGGSVLSDPLPGLAAGFVSNARPAVAVLLGRLTQYTANVLYDRRGQPLPVGAPAARSFETKEIEFYVQDTWRVKPNLTLTAGLRWSGSSPVQEASGFQTAPTQNLSEYFDARVRSVENGSPYNAPIAVDLAGSANGRPDPYPWDRDNFSPSVSVAWSPNRKSVLRSGFRMLYDHFGSSLISFFDSNNSLGFFTSLAQATSFNVTNNLPPLFTGQTSTRDLPYVPPISTVSFPRAFPSAESGRLASALDGKLETPVQYTWNASYGRDLGRNFTIELAYVGRSARHLLLSRDIVQRNNIREKTSGQTWFEAAGILGALHDAGLGLGSGGFNTSIPRIPFFENLFPGDTIQRAAEKTAGRALPALNGLTPSQQAAGVVARGSGLNMTNWVGIQNMLDDVSILGRNLFVQPQYSSLLTYSTLGSSDYHGAFLSVLKRFSDDFLFDFNYTLSKAFDTGSTLEGANGPNFEGLLLNALSPSSSRSVSDFDMRHNFNANYLVSVPVGRGKRMLRNASRILDALVGGWQLTGVWRYQSGIPLNFRDVTGRNAVAGQQASYAVRIRPIETSPGDFNGQPYLFSNPTAAYQSFRNARAGEVGDRNVLRLPRYTTMDMGLAKSFRMPYSDQHSLQVRWEVFNVTNSQPFGGIEATTIEQDPYSAAPQAGWGRFSQSQTPGGGETRPGRVMQFALRYAF